MPTYRLNPVKADAVQWFKMGDHPAVFEDDRYGPMVETDHGSQFVRPGNYVLTFHPNGNHIVLPKDVFEANYTLDEDASPQFEATREVLDILGQYSIGYDQRLSVQIGPCGNEDYIGNHLINAALAENGML